MIQGIIEFLQEIALRHHGEAVMAWVQFIPAILSAGSAIYGGLSQARKNREMRGMVNKWNAENQSLFNNDYYKDYTQTQEAQNIIRQMRDMQDRQAKRDANTAVITGGTVEAQAAAKEARNRAMSNLFANLGAQGTRWKERAKDRYLHRKSQIQNMQYNQLAEQANSAGNLMYNGLSGLAGMDWAGIMGNGSKYGNNLSGNDLKIDKTVQTANPIKNVSGIIPSSSDYNKSHPLW